MIRIALPERIEGKGGQTLSPGLVVSKATHGLKNVQWEAPSLLAEGGKITGQGSQWQVTLPAYRPVQRQLLCDFLRLPTITKAMPQNACRQRWSLPEQV